MPFGRGIWPRNASLKPRPLGAATSALATRIALAVNGMNEAVRLRLSVEEAVDRIAADIADYLDGGPDREVENIELGMGLGLKIEGIRSRWASAREQKATIEAVRPTETELK